MSDRKYKQRGYQDSGREEKRPDRRPPRENLGGPRMLNMPGRSTVLRCSSCGSVLPLDIDTSGQCPRCSFELHSCKQCMYFDTSSRFECAKPIPVRIARKDARNDCTFYEPRATVERETGSAGVTGRATVAPTRPSDARAAFDSLFKK